jgi:hypothetical protein
MEVLDQVLNWILPVNSVALVLVGVLLFAILACIGVALACNYSKWWFVGVVFFGVFALFNLGWAIYGGNQPRELDRTEDYEVKTVTYPDGSQVQMYTMGGKHYNANEQFKCQVPETKVVRRYIYKTDYVGIRYSRDGGGNGSIKDEWALADKGK